MSEISERALVVLNEAIKVRDEAQRAIAQRRSYQPAEVQPRRRSRRGCLAAPVTFRRCCVCGLTFEDKGLWSHQDQTGHTNYEMFRIWLNAAADDA